jgi:small subunit ribosomal protein S1
MKRLVPDPWIEAAKTFKIGTIVEGEINKITQFGAFMQLSDEINGLIHLSEITEEPVEDASTLLKVGEKVKAKIISVDPDEHRIGLSIKALTAKPKKVEVKEEKVVEKAAEETATEEA